MARVLLTLLLTSLLLPVVQAAPLAQHAGYALGAAALSPSGWFEAVARRNGHIGPGEAARVARAAYGGRVLAVHAVRDGSVYRVRLLAGGQVRVVLVDARTGRVLH